MLSARVILHYTPELVDIDHAIVCNDPFSLEAELYEFLEAQEDDDDDDEEETFIDVVVLTSNKQVVDFFSYLIAKESISDGSIMVNHWCSRVYGYDNFGYIKSVDEIM